MLKASQKFTPHFPGFTITDRLKVERKTEESRKHRQWNYKFNLFKFSKTMAWKYECGYIFYVS